LNRAEDPDAKTLFSRIFTLFTALGMFVFLAVSFFSYELVSIPLPGGHFLIPPAYWLGLHIVPVALLAYVFQGWYYNFSVGIYLNKQTKYLIHATLVGGAVSLVLTALLVPKIGMMGAAIATALSFGSMSAALLFYSQREYHIPYDWGSVGVVSAAAGVAFSAWWLIPSLQIWWAEALLLLAFAIVVRGVIGRGRLPEIAVEAKFTADETHTAE